MPALPLKGQFFLVSNPPPILEIKGAATVFSALIGVDVGFFPAQVSLLFGRGRGVEEA